MVVTIMRKWKQLTQLDCLFLVWLNVGNKARLFQLGENGSSIPSWTVYFWFS